MRFHEGFCQAYFLPLGFPMGAPEANFFSAVIAAGIVVAAWWGGGVGLAVRGLALP